MIQKGIFSQEADIFTSKYFQKLIFSQADIFKRGYFDKRIFSQEANIFTSEYFHRYFENEYFHKKRIFSETDIFKSGYYHKKRKLRKLHLDLPSTKHKREKRGANCMGLVLKVDNHTRRMRLQSIASNSENNHSLR